MRNQIRFQRYFKRTFYRLKLHKLFPANAFETLSYLSHASNWINRQQNLQLTSFPYSGFDYGLRINLFETIKEKERLDTSIDYFEFGVAKGHSFRWWTNNISDPGASFFGFDTFTGLPEDWGPFKKGDMSNGDELPQIEGNRHHFYQGLFQDTLPQFLLTYSSKKRKVIHLDADIFTATLFVLTSISPYLKKGDILFFDEFNVPLHEFKAFKIWTESFYINYTTLGEVNNFYQTAIRIE